MRRTIGASESSSIYLLGICVGSLLSLFLSLILRNVSATLDGMSVYSWCGYAIMQVGFIATVFVYARVRKIDVVRIAKLSGRLNPMQIALLPLIAIATILVFLPLANAWSAFLGVIGYHGAGVPMPSFQMQAYIFLLFSSWRLCLQ